MSQTVSSGGNDSSVSAGTEVSASGSSAAAGAQDSSASGGNDSSSSSLLTREDGEASVVGAGDSGKQDEGKEGKDGEGSKPDDNPAEQVPSKPEDYVLTFADDVQVDDGLLNSFKAKAHEMGIPQGKAQELASFYAKNVADSGKAAQEAQTSALMEAKKGWETEITARPGFKQEVADAKRTLKEFGSPELNELMDHSLLGSHPVFFDFVVKVGKALAEPEARGRGVGGGSEKPLDQRLWPNMK